MKLLCLSQDKALEQQLEAEAGRLSWSVVHVHDRHAVGQAVEQYDPDMVLVDASGLDDLSWWKQNGLSVSKPVIFLNQELNAESMAAALESGADGMIPKPLFSSRFFELRVRSLMRRNLSVKRYIPRLGLLVDLELYVVKINDQEIDLTLTEFKILRELATQEDRVVPRQQIQNRVFGDAKMSKRSLDVHVCALRKKLNPMGVTVDSVRGVGYRLNPLSQ